MGNFGSEWAAIAENLRLIMDDSSRRNEQDRVFRYPLATATYQVEEVVSALESMATFRTTMWSKTQQFESRFSSNFRLGESVMVNSGSSADLLVAFALRDERFGGLEPGDEVLAPAVTWPTQIWSLLMAGYIVQLVDADPFSLNISTDDLERKIGPRTRAISLVHLMGNTANLDEVVALAEKHGLVIIEDACEALSTTWRGQPVGSFGLASSFSFFFSHHLVTMEGGMISTKSEEFAEHLRLLRAHGWTRNLRRPPEPSPGLDPRYSFESWGFNVRPTELNAAFGLEQLKRFDILQRQRSKAAEYGLSRIKQWQDSMTPMKVAAETGCSWFAFPVMISKSAKFQRDDLVKYLELNGVETRPIVAGNLGRQPATKNLKGITVGDLPGADFIHDNGFYFGLHPLQEMEVEFERVWDLVDTFMRSTT